MRIVYTLFRQNMFFTLYIYMHFKTYISEQEVEGGRGRDSGGRWRFLRRRNQRRGDQGDDGEEGQRRGQGWGWKW